MPVDPSPLVAGVFGLAVGSFLNVCSLRWPVDESVVAPGSRCPACGASIRWYDNVPIASWLLLRGRCRSCGRRISLQYPLVELATALLWAAAFARFGPSFEGFRSALFLTLLFGIALSDARFYVIPDQFSLGGLALGVLLALGPGGPTIRQALTGAALGYGLLWLVRAVGEKAFGREAMGGGDVKMMAMVGAFLAPAGVLMTLFLGALLGSVIFGPISYRTGKLVPFGIFLALGAVIVHGWGDLLLAWYVASVWGTPP